MTLLDGILARQDSWGLIQGQPNKIEGNGLLTSAEALAIVGLQHSLTGEELHQYAAVADRVKQAIPKCLVGNEPGFYTRHPEHFRNDQEGPDDYVALAYLFTHFGWTDKAQEVLDFWERGWKFAGFPFWVPCYVPNEGQYRFKYGWRAHHWKFFAMRASMHWAAGREPGGFLRFMWELSIETTGDFAMFGGAKHDPWILSWLSTQARKNAPDPAHRPCLQQEQIFTNKLLAKFPGGMKQVFAEYFAAPGAPPQFSHPFSEYFPA